ncbi:MAG: metal ABC transporter permease [Gammaproteobacteria bacterium]|nr:metal ABC transporter permease [Gammaproteobacteria bacterium]
MFDSFIVRAAVGGLAVALACAPLGCFVVWRRMAYFGDATAHAAILGVAIALAFSVSIFIGTLGIAVLVALLVTTLSNRGHEMDTLLGVIAHSALAMGLVAASFLPSVRIDLSAYLFGDILSISRFDLGIMCAGAVLVLVVIRWRWSSLLTATINPELAHAAGINPKREQLFLAICLALVVAVAIKVVGVLLITAMLIIPAAAARNLSRTPENMALGAALLGTIASMAGLYIAYLFDTPAGPTMVCVAALCFAITSLWTLRKSI